MPTYEYQGQQYNISTDDPAEAKRKILAHLGTPEKTVEPEKTPETTSRLENMALQAKSGWGQLANTVTAGTVGAASLGVDKLISGVTGEDYNSPVTDFLSKNIIQPNLDLEEKAKESAKQHQDILGTASTVAGDVGGMIPAILAGSPLQSVQTYVPKLGAGILKATLPAVQKGFAGIQPMAVQHGVDRALESNSKDNSIVESILSGLGGYGNMAMQGIAPMGMPGSIGARVGTGAVANAALGIPGRQFENATSPDNMQQDPYDPKAIITDALTGGIMHGVLGAKGDTTKPTEAPVGDPRLGETQHLQTSLDERIVQISTAKKHADADITRLSSKETLSLKESERLQRLIEDSKAYEEQLAALKNEKPPEVIPKTEEDISLKPLDDIPDSEFKPNHVEEITLKPLEDPLVVQQAKGDAVTKYIEAGWHPEQANRYVESLHNGDIVGALKELGSNQVIPIYQRVLAKALSAKEFLKDRTLTIDEYLSNNGKNVFGLSKSDGNILLQGYDNPKVFIHEALHSVTRGALAKFRQGMPLSFKAKRAVHALTKLYSFVNTPENHAKFTEMMVNRGHTAETADRYIQSIFKNVDEFLAHGTGSEAAIDFLRTVPYKKTTGLSAMVKELSEFFGWTNKETTALQKLYEVTDKLVSEAKASDLIGNKDSDLNFDPNKPVSDQINLTGAKINGKLFTAQLSTIYGNNPVVKAVDGVLRTAERKMDTLINNIFGGTTTKDAYLKSSFYTFTMKKLQSGDGLIPAVLRNSYEEIHGVVKTLQEGHDLGRSYQDTLNTAKFNTNQKALADALIRMAQQLWTAENKLRVRAGLRQIPYRAGWFPAIRRGDHAVVIARNGVPFQYETFLSKAEADGYLSKYSKGLDNRTDSIWYESRKPNDNTENVLKLFDDVVNEITQGRNPEGLRNELMNDQAGVTTHAIRREGVPGFIGTELGQSPAASGKRFADHIESYVREYAESIRKREVMLETDTILSSYLSKTNPNGSEVAKIMRDYSIGKTSETQWLKDAGTWWKGTIDNALVNRGMVNGKLDVHAWDRMTGFLSHIFYAHTLTMRPAIWVSQILTYFNSLRQLGREDISSLDAMAAVTESWMALAKGKHVDADMINGIMHVSQNLNTFHPQLTNQLNRLSVGRNPESTANKILHILTGEKMSSAADTASRFMTWMTYYQVYKKQGLSGKELWNKAAEASDDNMFMYNKSHQPALYRDLGIVGEQMSPLKTFAHGQLGLLVSDLRHFVNQPSAKTAVPFALSSMAMVIFGGAISAPILAEYELLRKLAVNMGLIGESDFPSVTKVLLEKPDWLSHGVVSSVTGMDIGASMRYNSLIGNLATAQNTWSALFPASGFVATTGMNAAELLSKKARGVLTEGEKYAHTKKMLPKGPVWAAVDETVFDSHNRSMVPMGKRGEALTPQTDTEIWAARFGSRSVNEAKDSTKNILNVESEKKRNESKAKGVDLILDGNVEKGIELLTLAQVNPDTIKGMLLAQGDRRNRPVLDRFYTNKHGGVSSYEQRRKLLDMVGYIENQHD